jgi:putative ABC transport system ATP-binding protein
LLWHHARRIILADEPSGQLDSQTGRQALDVMRHLTEENNITLVIVTHDMLVMEEVDDVFELHDGMLVDERS